ncbi:hypothetical protein SYJ56_12860 [Algoriphagus sp. D3-2-R+10]|uniref:beta strand repeat-containing protein n=1 Tax=Algoriphagus aurantiacus TaxID=3103948 RepID=UPI002B3C6C73|nr:hypothetical protein [Algoriphagus sp. D3-2-R+10]MEB2776206.1 hypothetical protein [Algoriphagus sp. D3-2-R+10]
MKNRFLFVFMIFCCTQIFWGGAVWGQCSGCSANKTYLGPATVNNINANWTPTGKINNGSSVTLFNGTNTNYSWAENDLQIGGIILSNGADLSLNRSNLGNNPGFSIQGGCIVIGSGSVLSLIYITELTNVTICIEDGGKLILDSREETRNDFSLDGVQINLQSPNAEIEIGDADFVIGTGGVTISGWTGDATGLCPSTSSGVAGSSGNISWTADSEGSEICKILNANSSCGPTGCDVIVNGNTITGTIQDGSTICVIGSRGSAIDLQNKDNLIICVSAGINLSGLFSNYNSAKKITVNVYGTVSGNLTLNNSLSSFNVFSGGQYNSYGTLTIQNGTASNEGTITNTVNVSTTSAYFNSGTQSGQVTLNNSASYTNLGSTTNSVILNNISSYSNSGYQSGDVTIMNPNSTYTINPSGTHLTGTINTNNGLVINQGVTGAQVNLSGNGEYRNEGTQNNQVLLSGNSNYRNFGITNGNVSLSDNSNYTSSGSQTGNLTINSGASVTNSGTLNLTNLNFDTNNSGMVFNSTSTSTLNVSNSATMSGTITLNGTSTFNDNVTFTTNNGSTTVLMDGSASLNVAGTFNLARNSTFSLTNSSGASPPTTVTVGNLNFPNDGGSSIRPLNITANTIFNVLDVANIQSGTSQLNVEGEFRTGINNLNPNTNTLIVGNNGSGTPTRIHLSGNGNLSITGSASISKHISAEDNSSIGLTGNLVMENNGDNSFTISDNVSLSVQGNTTLNKPMYASGTSSVNLAGDLTLPNVNSELVINDDANFYVGGNTSVESPIRMNDNSYVTFDGNVNQPNVGGAVLDVNNNSDVLITGNLTKSGGSVDVSGTSQLVICDARRPSGTITGSFPSAGSSGVSIGASPAYYGGCRILPVEFLSFIATYQSTERSALLEWSTAKEWENSHFEVERAINSVNEWETIGRIEGNGYADRPIAYSFTDDELPPAGGNVFFRLKQIDYDESFIYSNTKAIQVPSLKGSGEAWIAYPNPSTYGTEVGIKLIQPERYQEQTIYITLNNLFGQTESFSSASPEAISSTISSWLNGSASGLYVLDINWGNQRQQIKMVRN